ncbi:MAG TPA: bifunctional 4-hydroxy-2-oxoglutarate aldolase/2-dehydro-3-deoxy-phosphogluconate aldolase [Jiangellaceae bacterium]|nr:bifunctional 4-hydroxy-2-oxoglutarate aldolase/2-dehydro-3-deoxy-phosphogluconate aldolase [Jiangellaceae bacterium]
MQTLQSLVAGRPVVAVLRAPTAEHFAAAVDVLAEAGLPAVEVTLSTAGALDCIAELQARHGASLAVGAGTVRDGRDAQAAIEAGAQFVVSQVTDRAVAGLARAAGVPYVPGALTPNEILAAWALEVEAVKVSPVGPLGGPAYIRELHGPMPEVALMPTGGVEIDDVPGYFAAGATFVGASARLMREALAEGGDLTALGQRAEQLMNLVPA